MTAVDGQTTYASTTDREGKFKLIERWFEFIEINEFSERYPTTNQKTSKSSKENRESKDGKGEKTLIRGQRSSLPVLSPVPSSDGFCVVLLGLSTSAKRLGRRIWGFGV